MRQNDDSALNTNHEYKFNKKYKNDSCSYNESSTNKSRIYNLEYRKKPAELVRKDLISAMKLADHEILNQEDYILIGDSWREEWEKGVQVPVNPESLPQSTVKPIENELIENSFNIPKNLIKYDDSIDDHQSSYELDLQDICWLQSLEESDLDLDLSQNFVEYVIDQLEHQCAHNLKTKQVGIEYDDHVVCDVCQSPDGEDGNEIVFCDSCNIGVHQACYGIQEIPDGDWLCRPCEELGSQRKKALCVLCPNVGGALKPTTKNKKWAHVSCVYWIPEAKFLDTDNLEPVELKFIKNWRWNLVCSLCNIKKGAPIFCDEKNCRLAYHVTCAFKHKLKLRIALPDEKAKMKIQLKSYCVKHSENRETNTSDSKCKEIDFYPSTTSENHEDKDQKKSSLQCEFWKYVDLSQISQDVFKKYLENDDNNENRIFNTSQNHIVNETSLDQIIDLIFQYWKLKRLSNYGNSLIKMSFAEKFKEQLKFHKNQILSLRYHLERLRTLTYMLCRREKIKQNWVNTQKEIISTTLKMVDDECDRMNEMKIGPTVKFLTSEHKKLFSKIISHQSIYSKKVDETNDDHQNDQIIKNDDIDLNQTTIDNPESSSFIGSNSTRKRKSSENSITNSLLREIKRLKRSQMSKNNPYAKIYLSSTKSRKSASSSNLVVNRNNEDNNNNNKNNVTELSNNEIKDQQKDDLKNQEIVCPVIKINNKTIVHNSDIDKNKKNFDDDNDDDDDENKVKLPDLNKNNNNNNNKMVKFSPSQKENGDNFHSGDKNNKSPTAKENHNNHQHHHHHHHNNHKKHHNINVSPIKKVQHDHNSHHYHHHHHQNHHHNNSYHHNNNNNNHSSWSPNKIKINDKNGHDHDDDDDATPTPKKLSSSPINGRNGSTNLYEQLSNGLCKKINRKLFPSKELNNHNHHQNHQDHHHNNNHNNYIHHHDHKHKSKIKNNNNNKEKKRTSTIITTKKYPLRKKVEST